MVTPLRHGSQDGPGVGRRIVLRDLVRRDRADDPARDVDRTVDHRRRAGAGRERHVGAAAPDVAHGVVDLHLAFRIGAQPTEQVEFAAEHLGGVVVTDERPGRQPCPPDPRRQVVGQRGGVAFAHQVQGVADDAPSDLA